VTADTSFAVGLGLTNDCNLCAHCNRNTGRVDCLSLADVRRVCDSLPIRAINLGTGENALHPEFKAILNELHPHGLSVTLTSNGYSTSVLPAAPQGSTRRRGQASCGFVPGG
jgi:MoaA/NifB/PqqE/SkfB family radical SAM enzyme